MVECYNCQFVVVSLIVSQRAFEVSQRASKTSQQSQPASKAGEATRQHAKPANQSAAVLRTIGGSAKRTSWLGCVIWYSRYCYRGEVPPPITASVTARAHAAGLATVRRCLSFYTHGFRCCTYAPSGHVSQRVAGMTTGLCTGRTRPNVFELTLQNFRMAVCVIWLMQSSWSVRLTVF